MASTNSDFATISADGDTTWVELPVGGGTACVDFVDANGVSVSWDGASVSLLFSPDARMRCVASDESGDITGKTAGFASTFKTSGYVAATVSSYSAGICKIAVVQ
jgi:hypothetical protein